MLDSRKWIAEQIEKKETFSVCTSQGNWNLKQKIVSTQGIYGWDCCGWQQVTPRISKGEIVFHVTKDTEQYPVNFKNEY